MVNHSKIRKKHCKINPKYLHNIENKRFLVVKLYYKYLCHQKFKVNIILHC